MSNSFFLRSINRMFLFCLILVLSGCVFVPKVNLNIQEERAKVVDVYLSEFCSSAFKGTKIGFAIREVLMRLPSDDLRIVMNRKRPVLFTEIFDSGTAQFASSSEIIATKHDIPAFQEGMTIIKLSTALEKGEAQSVMGIVAHELAHRVLDHVRKGNVSCKSEREANRLIKSWGFTKEFESASANFGREKASGGAASCQE